MIAYHHKNNFELQERPKYTKWIINVVASLGCKVGPINYIFCSDNELLKINQEYLGHDTYTDIITFEYSGPPTISGDIFISTDRVTENAEEYGVSFDEELRRVMVHGILHLAGYKDKTREEQDVMRRMEDELIGMFHVKH